MSDTQEVDPVREGLAEAQTHPPQLLSMPHITCVSSDLWFQVLPVNAKRKDGKNDVFYNPAQVHMQSLGW